MDAKAGRLQKTSLGGFHQILVLGQKYLNDSFHSMYKLLQSTEPDHPLLTFKMGGLYGGMSDCKIEAPEVQLLVEGANLQAVTWILKIKSGKLWLIKNEDTGEKIENIDVTGWVVPFNVPIDSVFIKKGTDEHNKLAKRFDHFSNDQFCMYKIFLDCSQAEATTMKKGDYKGFDWDKAGREAASSWQTMVQKWINKCGQGDKNILGLVAQPDSNIGTPATYPPIWLSRQAYPFLDPGQSNAQASNGHSFNALVYLMMNDDSPKPSPALLNPVSSGNWLVPNDNLNGSYCLSRTFFWDHYMLPKLYAFVEKVAFHVSKPGIRVWNVASPEYTEEWFWSVGSGIPSDSKGKQTTTGWQAGPLEDGLPNDQKPSGSRGRFHIGIAWQTPEDGDDRAGGAAPNGVFRVTAHNSAWQWFTINYTPGTNLIEVEGKSKIDANVEYRGSNTPAWRTGEDAWYKASWKLGLEITSIEGGGITIKVQDTKDNGVTIDKGHDGSSLKKTIIPYYLDEQVDTLHNDLKSALDRGLSWARSSLQDALKDQGRLFLPGNGALIFKNATFNENGDLLVEVKFDGTGL